MDYSSRIAGKKVLVTGGLGFVGHNLVKELLNYDCKITLVDDASNGNESILGEKIQDVEFHKFSVTETDNLYPLLDDVNFVFHLACVQISRSSSAPMYDMEVNAGSTLKILEYYRKNKSANLERFVYTSTASIYGTSKSLPIGESDPVNILSHYAATKYLAENYVNIYNSMYDIPTAVVRYSNVYGYGQSPTNPYCGVLGKFIHNVLTDKPLYIFGDGEQTRDYTFITDAVRATILAATHPRSFGDVFNIGTSVETSVNNLISVLKLFKPDLVYEHIPERDIDNVRKRSVDISKIHKRLGWLPEVNIMNGLKKTMDWYKGFLG
ncbi:MAG: NAD-dependent epimerase/dehydratase family protein [Ignavibacteriaceae bacterium]